MYRNKRLMIALAIAAAIAIIFSVVVRSFDSYGEDLISPSADKVSYDDVKDYLKKVDFSKVKESGYFTGNIVNKHTIRFFKYMQYMFKDKNYEDHLMAIKEYLLTVMSPDEAEKMMELYRKFLEYENKVAMLLNQAGQMKNIDDYLQVLKSIRKVQVESFGEDYADILFGAEMKAQEYPLRRNSIINDDKLYGKEKEEMINELNREMWGDKASEIESSAKPYAKYREKLNIYNKDMNEMSESGRKEKIKEFRESIFPPDVVDRLNEVDEQLASDEQRDRNYRNAYEQIASDNNLTDAERKEKIYNLQNSVYGDQADAIRSIENMERGKGELLKEMNMN